MTQPPALSVRGEIEKALPELPEPLKTYPKSKNVPRAFSVYSEEQMRDYAIDAVVAHTASLEAEVSKLRDALADMHNRLLLAVRLDATARETYDSGFQEMVVAALSANQPSGEKK